MTRRQTPRPTLAGTHAVAGNNRPVSERALLQRINRALPRGDTPRDIRGRVLKVARGKGVRRFYLAKKGRGAVIDNVDIDALARRLSVLDPREYCPGAPPVLPAGHPRPDPMSGHAWPHNVGEIRGYAVRTPRTAHVIRKPKTRIVVRMSREVGWVSTQYVNSDHIRDKVSGKRKR